MFVVIAINPEEWQRKELIFQNPETGLWQVKFYYEKRIEFYWAILSKLKAFGESEELAIGYNLN